MDSALFTARTPAAAAPPQGVVGAALVFVCRRPVLGIGVNFDFLDFLDLCQVPAVPTGRQSDRPSRIAFRGVVPRCGCRIGLAAQRGLWERSSQHSTTSPFRIVGFVSFDCGCPAVQSSVIHAAALDKVTKVTKVTIVNLRL